MTDWAALLDALEDGLESFPPVPIDVAALPAAAGAARPVFLDHRA